MAKVTYVARYTAEEMELLLDKGMKLFGLNATTASTENTEETTTETETETTGTEE